MSHDLSDVLHRFADDQSRASAAEPVDPAVRARTVAALVRRRRSRHLAGAVASTAALIVAGTLAANALTPPPPPEPAVPVPSTTPSATASPTPTPTTEPTPTSSSALPARTELWVRGYVDSLDAAPTARWTVLAGDVVAGWAEELPPRFGDIVRSDIRPGVRMIDAGDTVVAFVADVDLFRQEIIALDAATGEVRWTTSDDASRPTYRCAGLSPDGLVACLGSTGPAGMSEIQLLDAATGEIVRSYTTGFSPENLGVAGAVAVVHGTANSTGTDVRWDGIDLTTGELLWSHLAPGRGEPYEITGDPSTNTLVSWPYARLEGYFYEIVIDVRTGAEITGPAGRTFDVDLGVWAPSDPETVPVLDLWAHGTDGEPQFGVRAPLRALDPTDGSVLWSLETAGAMPAAVVGDVLVVSDETTTSALDMATGRFLWTMPVRGSVMATDGARILLDGGTVLRIDDGGVVVPSPALAGAVPLGRTVHLVTAELIDVEEGTEALTLLGW